MAKLEHVYSKYPKTWPYALILTDTFPEKSLLFGTDARYGTEIRYQADATKTGGGTGKLMIDSSGVPSIEGTNGEYTFQFYVNDRGTVYGPLTGTLTTTPYADVTAPTVTVTTTGNVTDLQPALAGTVNDATARVVVTVRGKDYVAINDGVGGWSIAAGVIDPLPAEAVTITARAIDGFDNVGSGTNTITYTGSAYAFVSQWDVAALATANAWTDGQAVREIFSSVGNLGNYLSAENATTLRPSYSAADSSLAFTVTPATRIYNTVLPKFKELFFVFTDTNITNFLNYIGVFNDVQLGVQIKSNNNLTSYLVEGSSITGRVNGAKNIIALRVATDSFVMSVNGGADQTKTKVGLGGYLSRLYIHEPNLSGCSMKVHEIVTTDVLNSTQRTALITALKTKWGIA